MNIIYEKFSPSIEDAKTAHLRNRFSVSAEYNEYYPCLATTNELHQIRRVRPYITGKSKILTVSGSGEQPLFFTLFGGKDITTFDISYNSYIMNLLKITAIQKFKTNTEYNELIDNLLNTDCSFSLDNKIIYNVVQQLGDTEKKYFSDIVENSLDVYFFNNSCDLYNLSKQQYKKLKRLVKQPFPFILTNITKLYENLGNQNFDIIYYSNIFSFMDSYDITRVLDTTTEHLNYHNGKIFLTANYRSKDDIMYILDQDFRWMDVKLLPKYDGFYQIIMQFKKHR